MAHIFAGVALLLLFSVEHVVVALKDGYASCYGDYRKDIASFPGCGFGNYVSGEDFTYTTAICNTWAQKVCGSCYHVQCDSGKSPNMGCSGKSVYVKAIDVLGSSCGSTPQSHIFDLNDVPWTEMATEGGVTAGCSGGVHVKYEAVSCQAAGLVTGGLKVGIMPDQCDPWCPPFWFANVGGAGAIFGVEVSTDGGATWKTYKQNAGNGARWDCPAGNADYRTSALSFRIELCDLAALPEACVASGQKMTWINELPNTWCPPHATNPNICGTTSFQLSSNFGGSVVSTTLASTVVATTTTTTPAHLTTTTTSTALVSTIMTTASSTTTTATDALVTTVTTTASVHLTTAPRGTCTGKPCSETAQCRSKWGWCDTGAAYCNDESTWTAQCSITAATTTAAMTVVTTTASLESTITTTAAAPSTTIAVGTCTGEPCPNESHCRSKWGWCNAGAAYCNTESTWTADCSRRRLLLARSAVPREGMPTERHGGSIVI